MNIIFFIIAWYVILFSGIGLSRNLFLFNSLHKKLDANGLKNNMTTGNVYFYVVSLLSLWYITDRWSDIVRVVILLISFFVYTSVVYKIGNRTINIQSLEEVDAKRSVYLLNSVLNVVFILLVVYLSRFFM